MLGVTFKSYMLIVVMLSVAMLSVAMLSVAMLSVVMLSVVMLSVVAPVQQETFGSKIELTHFQDFLSFSNFYLAPGLFFL